MDITPLISSNRQIIQGYSAEKFRISGVSYDSPVIVYPDRTEIWDIEPRKERLDAADFLCLINAGKFDVILFGCGPRMEFYPPSFKTALKSKGLHVEVMDTGAACRTYNVLIAEDRRVAAALLPVA
jgi:uncharacterized protein